MAKIDEIPIFYSPDRATWRTWLLENHETSTLAAQNVKANQYVKKTGTLSIFT